MPTEVSIDEDATPSTPVTLGDESATAASTKSKTICTQ
eukprot:CAMPEP_0171364904 /NCGR_PEP_ID=MMETSP0879-20121228/4325_1 /TAXON_ID=67004 /ORGANISM="Thalassiosira weissflogii, Strain CCMP1336" /LENGTH=37 /DNA_ID= /DNA_START= /DNA_END= /DNA_ORIENTATION=